MTDTSIEKRINEIIETQRDLQEESDKLHYLMERKAELDKINARISEINHAIDDETKAAAEDITEVGRKRFELHVAEMKQELEHLKARSNDLQKAILAVGFEQDKKGTFNKHILFRNVRELMKRRDVKLGQIEKEAGCQPGYMSRLEKEGNTTDPSMEFVVTAARIFNISVDLLINTRIDELTPTDEYILKFIKSLIDDTRDDALTWEKEMPKEYSRVYVDDYNEGLTSHPLFAYERIQTGPNDWEDNIYYNSRFFRGEDVKVSANSYHTQLSGSDAKLYIMSCDKVENDLIDDTRIGYIEMYLVSGLEVNPISCSIETSESVARAMEDLYKEIEAAAAHVHINQKARRAIDQYMEVKDCPF